MKKLILGLLLLALPIVAWAECENPVGKTFDWNDVVIHFVQGYGSDTIAQINSGDEVLFVHYLWNQPTCQAVLLTEPELVLNFDETWFDVAENPYRFAVVSSVD